MNIWEERRKQRCKFVKSLLIENLTQPLVLEFSKDLTQIKLILTAPTFLSGMILTFWTWPVVSKI